MVLNTSLTLEGIKAQARVADRLAAVPDAIRA